MNTQKLNQGLWAFGMTGGLLTGSFLVVQHLLHVPITPTLAYCLLSIPPLYFYVRSEYVRSAGKPSGNDQVIALTLFSAVLLMYSLPAIMTFLLLPEHAPGFRHYAQHAPVALGIGVLLVRLYALNRQKFSLYIGLTSVIAALFFLAIRIPEWVLGEIPSQSAGKTFEFFALVSIAISYLFLFAGGMTRILKTVLTVYADLPDDLWPPLQRYLITLLMAGSHSFMLGSLIFHQDQRLLTLVFTLLAGLWMIVGHLYRTIGPYWIAYAEILAAIYSSRFTYAWWPETWIIWLLLGLALILVVLYHLWLKSEYNAVRPTLYGWWGLTVLLMAYEYATTYELNSRIGLLPFLLIWGLGFCLPATREARKNPSFRAWLGIWLYMPALFVFLLQGTPALTHLPQTLLAALVISGLIMAYRVYEWHWITDESVKEPLALHHLHWFLVQPSSMLWIFVLLTGAALGVHALSLTSAPGLLTRHLFSMVLVQGTLVIYWFDLARKRKLWWATVAAELMVTGLLFSLRRGIPELFDLAWSAHWDMLVGWAVAVSIVALRSLLQAQDRSVRLPIRVTLFGLPILTAIYALDYQVDFEFFALIVLPLYSLLFLFQAYSERDRFVLSYAFVGMNAYLILLFLHQHLQSIQLYVTPVCLSILILVEVFRDVTSAATANFVRGAALGLILGVAMVQAIINNALSPLAHLIVLALSSCCVVAAHFLRVRIFATFGLLSFLVDLIALIYIVLSRQEIEALMVMLGGGLTLIGFLTLGGYYVYRQHKRTFDALFSALKARFLSWE